MTEKHLRDALNGIQLNDLARRRLLTALTQSRKPHKSRLTKLLAAICLTLFLFVGSAFAFNEDFRAFVISFFHSESVETLPPNLRITPADPSNTQSNSINYIGHQKIEGIATVHYLDLGASRHLGLGYITSPDGFFKIQGDDLVPLSAIRHTDSIQYRDWIFDLDFWYVAEDGYTAVLKNNSEDKGDNMATVISSKAEGNVWIHASVRYEMDTYLLYDLHSGMVQDIIGNSNLGGMFTEPPTDIIFSPDEKNLLIQTSDTAYLLNAETLDYQEIGEFFTSEVSASFIDKHTLSIWERNDSSDQISYDIYSYSISTKELTEVIKDAPYNAGKSPSITGLGGGFAILTEAEQYVLINLKTGEQFPIETLLPDQNIGFLLSPDGKQIALTTFGEGNNSLEIGQIGCIDIEKRELKIFDRQDFDEIAETSLYWMSDSTLGVTAGNNENILYIYEF